MSCKLCIDRLVKELEKQHKGVEVNGPANIIMQLDILESFNPSLATSFEIIRKEALKTITYMRHLQNEKGVNWHDIKNEDVES